MFKLPTYLLCSILKSIEFSNSTEEGDEKPANGDAAKAKSLEMLLLEKNRTLQTENTQLKVSSNELTGKSLLLCAHIVSVAILHRVIAIASSIGSNKKDEVLLVIQSVQCLACSVLMESSCFLNITLSMLCGYTGTSSGKNPDPRFIVPLFI